MDRALPTMPATPRDGTRHVAVSASRRPRRARPDQRRLAAAIAWLLLSLSLACAHPAARDCACPPDEADPPTRSFLVPGLDHGLVQSPINILSSQAASERHNVTVNFNGEVDRVDNLGHTVQVDFHPGSTIEFDGKVFDFVQLHFHTPSEHLIDGITYPMEMHLVNIRQNTLESETPEYLVFAFLTKMGRENRFISSFIDHIPREAATKAEVHLDLLSGDGVFTETLQEALNHYYFYRGALTTPPYTESVNWAVLKHIFEASPEQIMRINEIEGDNARHIQRVNERAVGEQ